jgi:hypothetical protein
MRIQKSQESDLIRNFNEIQTYYRTRQKYPTLSVSKLINLLTLYLETVLFFGKPISGPRTMRLEGKLVLLGINTHDPQGNPLKLDITAISNTLLRDIASDLKKVIDIEHFEMLFDLFTAAIEDGSLDVEYKLVVLDTENVNLHKEYDYFLKLLPETKSLEGLKIRKSFVLEMIGSPPPDIPEENRSALFNLHHFYVKSIARILISKNRFSEVLQYLYEELDGTKESAIITNTIFDIIAYNKLLVLERQETIQEKIDEVYPLIEDNKKEQIAEAMRFSLSQIELKDLAVELVEYDFTNVERKHIRTLISFVVPKKMEGTQSLVKIDDSIHVGFYKVTNPFDDPIFRYLDESQLNFTNGIPLSILSDVFPDVQNRTVITFIFEEFYHPDFEIIDDKISHFDFEEKEAQLGRKYFPHKERIIGLLRDMYSTRPNDFPFEIQKQEININFVSNYLVNYVDEKNESIFHKVYFVTNLDSFMKVKTRYLDQISALNLDDKYADIRTVLFDTYISTPKSLCSVIYRFMGLVLKRPLESGGTHKRLWHKAFSQPVSEPEAQPLIHSLLSPILAGRGIQISREVVSANGSLDFHCSYTKEDKLMKVCIELKNAHHSNLIHGLTHQLPAYMDAEGTKDGIFLVLWYKGPSFAKPAKYRTVNDLHTFLEKNIPADYRIRVMIVNCAEKIPPSELR